MKVLVTVPNLHWVHAHVVAALLRMQTDRRHFLTFTFPSNKPFENNLHHIVVDFLKGDWDFWLSIDADNPPRNNPLDLVELDKDVIGLPTPVWHFTDCGPGERPVYWNAYNYSPPDDAYKEHVIRDGLQEVDAIGTGCFLASRRVFEHPELQKGAFLRTLYPDGTVNKGNDIAFCERVKNAGFRIWTHYDYPCNHFSEVELNSVVKAMRNLYEEVA